MEAQLQECLQCYKPLKTGRADKKFCGEGCKNAYHNAQKLADHAEVKKVNGTLMRNRRILRSVLGDRAEQTVTHEQLLKMGFEFGYHTHLVVSHYQKNQYTFCYNYGYRPIDSNRYKVVKGFK